MTLRLHDTASRAVRDFVPLEEGKAGIYVCGLTVQSEPHVGHVRSAVNFDVLRRWLEHSGYEVDFIRNVTDIDDKILVKAAEQGLHWYELAQRMHHELDDVLAAINVRRPTYEPAATGHVPEILELIGRLVAKGHAYAAEDGSGDVYFDVASWSGYGELTRQNVEDMEPAEVVADPHVRARKRDPRDFALWKGHKKETEPDTAAWPSAYGPGRPGWHIECSAMARKYLGPAFDIHGGGVDLRFPHHENEQAQSRAAGDPFAAYWLHNAWITTSGEKMSKSLGNSLLVPKVLERVRGIELRYYMVSAHYRSTVEFSFEALEEAATSFRRIESFLERAQQHVAGGWRAHLPRAFVEAMDDDLGTPAAIAVLHETVREGNRLLPDGPSEELTSRYAEVIGMLDVLGLSPEDFAPAGHDEQLTGVVDVLVRGLLDDRARARAAKDWTRADAIRDQLKTAGVEIEDTPDGPKWGLDTASQARPVRERGH